MIDERFIQNWFNYHAPTKDQQTNYETIRAHAREFAHIINNLVPDGADKSTALRKLREVVMTANAAIACQPEHDRIIESNSTFLGDEPLAPARKTATTTPERSPYQTTSGFSPESQYSAKAVPAGTPLGTLVDAFAAGRHRR